MKPGVVLITDWGAGAGQPFGEQGDTADTQSCKQDCQHESEFSSRSASNGFDAEFACLSYKYWSS